MQKNIILFSVLFLFVFIASLSSAGDDVFLQQGIAQYKAENYEEALSLLLKAKTSQPTSTLAAYYLGLTYKHLEKHPEAREQFLAALNQAPPVQDAYTELIETLYILDDLKSARQWIEKAEQAKARPSHIAFLNGLILTKEDRNGDAIAAFNKAKSLDSSLSQSADFQIALIQIRMRRFDAAKKSLQTISAIDPASDIASFAREYERALVKTLEASNKWQVTAGLAYQYDDNVLLKPTDGIPGVAISNESDSSVIATLSVVTPSLSNGAWSVSGRYNFYSNTHFSLHTHDIINNSLSLVPVYALQNGALSFPLTYSHVLLHQKEYMGLLTFRPTLQLLLAPGHIFQTSVSCTNQMMFQPSLDPDEDRDAAVYTASAGYIHPFNQGRNVFNLMYEFSKQDTDGRNWKNVGHRISTGFLLPFFRSDLNLALSGDIFFQDFDNVSTVFNLKRHDWVYTGSANLRWEISKKLSMNLQYSHTTADSNISVYDYKRNIFTAGFELQF